MISKRALAPTSRRRDSSPASAEEPKKATAFAGAGPSVKQMTNRQRLRLAFVGLAFLTAMLVVAIRFADIAAEHTDDAVAPIQRLVDAKGGASRAEIRDRNGQTLATDLQLFELYLDGRALHFDADRAEAVADIQRLFPDIDANAIRRRIDRGDTALVRRPITPQEAQSAHLLGIPGLYSAPRLDRLYPAGAATAHLLGWTSIDGVGKAGLELGREVSLSAAEAKPLDMSIDLRVQLAVRDSLGRAMRRFGARAAAAAVMDVDSGEMAALVSLPDFDPHARPTRGGDGADDPALFPRAVAGRYELGSVFKIFTWALALDAEVATPAHVYPPRRAIEVGRHTIRDEQRFTQPLSFDDAFARSSNVVAASLALQAGAEAQRGLFERLGLMTPTGLEVVEARRVAPIYSAPWSNASTATASFGHGVAATPAHLASAVARIVNGGVEVRPTLLKAEEASVEPPRRVISARTSQEMRRLMRYAVTNGTGRAADAPGYRVGGKTGTAEKLRAGGGYDEERVLATFAAAFPMDAPRYVVVVMLDEPTDLSTGEPRRGAGVTAAPVVGEIIPRIGPLLGVRPRLSEITVAGGR